ncbi:MAG: hypothetical protein ACF8LL_07015 [Phycisphaerales bacterium]
MPNPSDLHQDNGPFDSAESASELSHAYGQTPTHATRQDPYPVARVQIRRDVFWQNVCREILMGLAAAAAESAGRTGIGPTDAEMSPSPTSELFDGRMAVMTAAGQRIPIADVYPVFAYSMLGDDEVRTRSNDVQCTVFRITTPGGENFTLPISQIISVHSLSQSLIEKMEQAQELLEGPGPEDDRVPFGFAAYTSLARSEQQTRQQQDTETQNNDQNTHS